MKVKTGELIGVAREELLEALQESLGLQKHYAELLNAHDGGSRTGPDTVVEWIERLRKLRHAGEVIPRGPS